MKPFEIYADASTIQLRAVITQGNRPIDMFFSRKLSVAQAKYSVTKIELLAIVETFNSLSAKSVLAREKLVATYSIST